jgi:hypothetical protein
VCACRERESERERDSGAQWQARERKPSVAILGRKSGKALNEGSQSDLCGRGREEEGERERLRAVHEKEEEERCCAAALTMRVPTRQLMPDH